MTQIGKRSGSRIAFSSRRVCPRQRPNERTKFVSAERNYQRYAALAREASEGRHVTMENFDQLAEHYFRVMRTAGGSDE